MEASQIIFKEKNLRELFAEWLAGMGLFAVIAFIPLFFTCILTHLL